MTLVKLETPELTVIEESKAAKIKATFEPMVKMLESFEDQYNEIVSESQNEITLELCQKAKRLRIDVGKVRIETGKLKDKQKENIKLEDRAIMGVHNILVWATKEKEDTLKDVENHFELLEKKRLEELQAERVEMLSPYVEDAHERNLSGMELDVWNAYLAAKQKEYTDRIEAEKEAERKRIEEEKLNKLHSERKEIVLPYYDFIKDQDINNLGFMELDKFTEFVELLKKEKSDFDKEQEEIKKEKERLEKEAEKKRIEQEKERKEYEARLKKEAELRIEKEKEEKLKREKLEAELKAKEEAERKEKQRLLDEQLAKKKAEKAARLAPDKDKLFAFADKLASIELPELKNEEAEEILKNIETLISKTTAYIREKAETL